jgi:hypothetical protein
MKMTVEVEHWLGTTPKFKITGSKTFKRHMAQLDTGYYPEGYINGLRKAMHNRARKAMGWSVGRSFSGMTGEELDELLERVYSEPPVIMPEQAAKGLKWLMNHWHTPTGRERKNNPFGLREQKVLESFRRFRLIDFYDISTGILPFYVPVYRVESLNGNSFDYYAAAWQSGGAGPAIIG